MKKLFTAIALLFVVLVGKSQYYIQGSIQKNATDANVADILFTPDFDSQSGEYVNYLGLAIAIPTASATGVVPVLTMTDIFAGTGMGPASPFSYTSGTETIFAWVWNAAQTNMTWSNGVEFIGATVTFYGGTGSALVRLVDFKNSTPPGGANSNTYFLIVTNKTHPGTPNASLFDVTKYPALFYQSAGSSAPGTYGNGNQYVETSAPVSMCSASPSAGTITGSAALCNNGSTTSNYTSNGNPGGAWASTNTGVATINSSTGVLTKVGAGTTNVTYTVTGCSGPPAVATKAVTINAPPNAGTISGITPLCISATDTYTTTGSGGTWSSTVIAVATVNSTSGLVTAVSAGTTTIRYTATAGGCANAIANKTLTVDPNVNAGTISGTTPLCIGGTATYSKTGNAGGTWTSTNTAAATVDPSTGLVTAVGAGTTNITYTLTGCGTLSGFQALTVDANVTAGTVSGTTPLNVSATATYTSNGTAGGSWSSTIPGVATVNASSGLVTAVAAGTTNITYTVSTGCGSPVSSFQNLTVNSAANSGTISGTTPLCIGATTTYTSNGDAGGTWSSTVPSVASVNASTGFVSALSAGTTVITYTVGAASSFKNLTVSANVNAGTVSGTSPLCIGATDTYTSSGTAGGSWTSTNTSVATVNSSTGLVTAVATGTTDITYTVNTGCGSPVSSFKNLTVNPNVLPGTVSGSTPLCIGATTTYTTTGTGGSWSSTNTSVATVNSSTGLVTAVGAGTTDITYTVNTGCGSPVSSSKNLTVSPNASAGTVSGASPLTIGSMTTYTSNGDAGGTWTSTNTSVATVNSTTGSVTAVSSGTTDITYTVNTGCGSPVSSFKTLTVTTHPYITGSIQKGTNPNEVNIQFLPNYTSEAGEYVNYLSISVAIPTASATGVTPVLTMLGTFSSISMTPAIPFSYTAGTETIYSWVYSTGGTTMSWTNGVEFTGAKVIFGGGSGATKARMVDFRNYIPQGGNNSNTYFLVVTNKSPFDKTNYTALFYPIVGANGSTTGNYANTDQYVETNDLISMASCNPSPNAGTVSGTTPLCIGATVTYTSSGDAGGSWSSTNTAVATVNASTGLVTAIGPGTTDITYTVAGCFPASAVKNLTVNPNANAGTVSGTSPLCIAATATYTSNGNAGGSWSSTNTSVATVNASSGLVTAVGAGTTDITYTVSSGCNNPVSAFKNLTVTADPSPGTITGTTPLCIGATTTYTTNGSGGGTWGSSAPGVATVNSGSGLVTAVSAGTTNIFYTVNACNGSPITALKTLTVNPNANAGTVTGTTALCIGATATYTSNGDAGGAWSSTNTSVATVNASSGLVTAVAAGTTNITYTVSTGCNNPVSAFQTLTVNANVNAGTVSGTTPLCIGATATYTSNGDVGGAWSSTNTSVATVNASTGLVTAVGAGTTNITYTISTGCTAPVSAFKTLTVSPNANAGTVSGTSPLCIGSLATYTSNGDVGGGWSSSNTSVATVNPASGTVTTIAAGTTNITYTVSLGCNSPVSAFKTLTISPNANAGTVSGTSPLCIGATATYTSNGDAGGNWSSTNTAVATVNSTTGLVTVVGTGTTNITYTVTIGCNSPVFVFKTLTVNPSVIAGTLSGTSPLCIGGTATYTSSGTAGGSWSSTNTSVATVNSSSGLVTAVAAGTTDITYTVSTGCGSPVSSVKTLTVSPNVSAGTVSGTSPLCTGNTTTYTSSGTTGGTWSSTNTAVATVNSTTGLVTAIASGTTNITYTVSSGCGSPVSAFKTLSVNIAANAGTVSGPLTLVIGQTDTYTSNGDVGGSWSSSDPTIATVNASTGLVTAVSTGTTNVVYTVTGGCGGTVSASKTLTVVTPTLTIAEIYPNPTRTTLNLRLLAPVNDEITVAIVDMSGKLVMKTEVNVTAGFNTVPIDVKHLPGATYMIKLVCRLGCFSELGKFVKL